MGLSVRNIVKLPILQTSKIKSGKEMMDKKLVEWISVIEVPVENFVRKNEFVLSTGIGCEGDPVLLEEFVKDIIDSGASALAFATGRYIYDIPDRVIQLAQDHQLIIIDVPWEVRFSDILHNVLQEINKDKQGERQLAEDVRQELINCVLHGKGLQDIVNTLYKHIKISIAIIDDDLLVRANKHFPKEILRTLYDNESDKIQPIPQSDILHHDHPLFNQLEEIMIENQMCYQIPIVNNHHKQGHILVQPKDREKLTSFVMNVLDHALTACALYFVKENAIEMTEVRLKDNFILNLAKKHTDVTNQLISKAQLLGYDLTRPYICIVGHITHQKKYNKKKTTKDSPPTSSLQSMNYYIQKEITSAGKLLHRRTMASFDENEVIIYLEADNHPYMETANQFLDVIERRLYNLLSGIDLTWGIATHKDGHYAFYNSYEEAKTALDIGKQQNGIGERTFFSDTRINRLLMALSDKAEIAEIVRDTLQPLLDYDKKRQTDLIYTFMIYNKYKGNVSQTARALNLHRQSLLHRLRNIESLTQMSLVDSDDLFLLDLSVRIWMLKKID
ncbi:PucR family transcriptional regulator ligand-binding domain-containing protein [Evansella sp. AB-P1]|uniref:PucR family transcriptional regulator n=1 Tax=Evansella sp. AB-P1 TaxID=3037653 RepID=UPI00241D463B|nr:PucR family transcriptional regulator [Evansella sp. AB-P1]MDG5787850.1 PucR family transcriptional regulator ligand-binding domain-containing protein [Evansella sp. AB-P1]